MHLAFHLPGQCYDYSLPYVALPFSKRLHSGGIEAF
jgi:hypothetical protein